MHYALSLYELYVYAQHHIHAVVAYMHTIIHSYDLFQDFECEKPSLGNTLPALYSSLIEVLSEFEMTELSTQQMFDESLCILKKIVVIGLNKTVSSNNL